MKGFYTLKNPNKYIQSDNSMNAQLSENLLSLLNNTPEYRSGWELQFFTFCDTNPKVQEWSAEPFAIPYYNPIKKKQSRYFPDVYMKYNNKKFLIEIKPKSQIPGNPSTSPYDIASQKINEQKFKEAEKFCQKNGWKFVVLSDDFFNDNKGNNKIF